LTDLLNRKRNNILDKEVPAIDAPVLRPTGYVKPQASDEARSGERKNEIRELQEMLGLRNAAGRSNPQITVTDPDEVERQVKINRINEINRQSPRFRITETESALRNFARQIRMDWYTYAIYSLILWVPYVSTV